MKRITFLMAGILCLISCNNEINDLDPIGNDTSDAPRITLHIPDATVRTYSTATANECTIDSIWILEFDQAGVLKNDTLIHGADILRNGQSLQLLPQLPFTPNNGNKIVLIANTGGNPSGVTYATINSHFPLNMAKGYYKGGEHLPMYGEIESWTMNSYASEMIRAVAKIQVKFSDAYMDGIISSPGPTLPVSPEYLKFRVYNFIPAGLIQPAGTPQAAPHTPIQTSTHPDSMFYSLQREPALESELSIYTYETPNSTINIFGTTVPDTQFDTARMCLLLVAEAFAYRIDFYDVLDKKFLDIKRNHHYTFTINRVNSPGYWFTNYQQAIGNPGSNIEYEIRVDDVATSHITSNGQYAIITSVDTAYVTVPSSGNANVTVATARYQTGTGMSPSLNPETANSISAQLVNPFPATFNIVNPNPAVLTNSNVPIEVNISSNFESGVLHLNLGNIYHDLWVKKK